MREYNFDGLVGPTHNYGGLSHGNVASQTHGGEVSRPKTAALEGLAKMRFVAGLGVGQAVLPPQMRPSLSTLRRLGFSGRDEDVIAAAATEHDQLLRLCTSASSMWTANAATVAASADCADGRVHLTPANLTAMFHRAIEAETTTRVLRAIFADEALFVVHDPLPGGEHFADEGAANHTRLVGLDGRALHLFAFGRTSYLPAPGEGPKLYPARQTLEASQAVARLHRLERSRVLFVRQHSHGIDAGAFHTDVLAVGNGPVLLVHELAFSALKSVLKELERLVPGFTAIVATEAELPVKTAVKAYPFNSQLLTRPDGRMCIIAPKDSEETPAAKAFLARAVSAGVVDAVHYLDLRQSMHNGGGPACLRQRIVLTDAEVAAIRANVLFTPALDSALSAWVEKHYRDELRPEDVRDPKLARESMEALDALTGILGLGAVYEFQR